MDDRRPPPTRRRVLEVLGLGAASLPLLACSSSPGAGADPDARPDASGDDCGPAPAAWASGGTAAMIAKACYPDPFAAPAASCPLVVCATTAGPCTAAAPAREDVSEGFPGLPVRLVLELVTAETCAPLASAVVEIWHTQVTGVYSGLTPSPGFCSGGDADAPNHSYFRGTQLTDAAGRVAFDTCFPGWYPGRAIHIHFRVTVGGATLLVSQLFFAQPLIDEIFAAHPDYRPHGPPDTPNAADGILAGDPDISMYLLDAARMSDGAMLASKRVAIRGAAQVNCTT